MTMKWMGALLALLAVIGLVASSGSPACAEMEYSGGTLVDCESMSIFQPRDHEDDADSDEGVLASIPLPSWLMGFLGAVMHGDCETTEVPEGQWTVCNDGFSMLERDGAGVAWALGLDPGERGFRNARAADERKGRDDGRDIVDCGAFACADYSDGPDDPEIQAYVDSLSPSARARLSDRLRAWEHQEIKHDLEQARAQNTALQERLKEMEAYEAQLERAESLAGAEPGAVAQAQPQR